MEDFGGIAEDLVVKHVDPVERRSTGPAEVVRCKLDRGLDTESHWDFGGSCMVMVGAANQKVCSGGRLWMFGFAGVTGAEESCSDRDTAERELVDWGLIGERKAE